MELPLRVGIEGKPYRGAQLHVIKIKLGDGHVHPQPADLRQFKQRGIYLDPLALFHHLLCDHPVERRADGMAPDHLFLAFQFLFQAFQRRPIHGDRGPGGFIAGGRNMFLLDQLRRFILLPDRLFQPGLCLRHLRGGAVPVDDRNVPVQFQQGITPVDFISLVHVHFRHQSGHFRRKPGLATGGDAAGQRQFLVYRSDDGPHDLDRNRPVILRLGKARREQQRAHEQIWGQAAHCAHGQGLWQFLSHFFVCVMCGLAPDLRSGFIQALLPLSSTRPGCAGPAPCG